MKKKTGSLIFIIIALVVSILVSLVFILNINTIVNNKSRDNVYNNTDETIKYLDNSIEISYEDIKVMIDDKAATYDENAMVDYLYENNQDSKFEGFGYYTTEIVNDNLKGHLEYYKGKKNITDFSFTSIDGASTTLWIRDERVLNQKATITRLSYVFDGIRAIDDKTIIFYTFDNKYCAYQSFEQYAELLEKPFGSGNGYYIIMADDGMVYENSLNHYTNIRSIFGKEQKASELIEDSFGENHTMIRSISAVQFIVTYSKMLEGYNDNDMYLFYFVPSTYLSDFSKSILQVTIIYIGVFSLAISFLALFFYLNHKHFKKTKSGFSILPYSYMTHYVLLVNQDGKIISRNKKFAESPLNCKSLLEHEVVELGGDPSKIRDLLENGAELTIEPKKVKKEGTPKFIKFLIIKAKSDYQLVGLDSDQKPYIPTSSKTMGSSNGKNVVSDDFAFTDDIYGIKNFKALNVRLDEIISDKSKQSDDLYLFYVGLRSRAEIIKMHGKQINEEVNIKLIEALKTLLDPNTEIYILEGSYFAFFTKLKDNYNALNAMMEKFKKHFKTPIKVFSNEMIFDIYYGIFPFSGFVVKEGVTPKKLIEKASFAYEKALTLKDRTFYLYDGASESILERGAQTLIDLSAALEKGELKTVFQPVYSLREDRVSGFECLLRWTNEKYRHESISEFIKVAEQTGLIHEIGIWTFKQSMQLLKEIGRDDLRISVNVSPAQFSQAGFANQLLSLFSEYNIPFSCIAIEITETFFMDNMQEIIDKIQYIRSQGIKVYLDDFGTGYSSLMYLAELPVDVIKIDKGFTSLIQPNKQVRSILSHLLAMANELNIDIVAEGVETDYEIKFYERQKANYIQGYYFSKPVPFEEAKEAIHIKRMKEGEKK